MNTDDEIFSSEETSELQYIQTLRKRLINKLTLEGENVPTDNADKTLLSSLLDGSDRSTFTRVKIKADKKRDETTHAAVKVVGEVLRSINARDYRPAVKSSELEIPLELALREFVPGEMDITSDPNLIKQAILGSE